MKLSFPKFEELFFKARKVNHAFILDWKASIEDIIFNIKNTCPELNIKSLQAKQVSGNWVQTVFINEEPYLFDANSKTLILDMISTINKHLKKIGQTLIFFDTQDDNYYFFSINLTEIPEYLEKGFVEI